MIITLTAVGALLVSILSIITNLLFVKIALIPILIGLLLFSLRKKMEPQQKEVHGRKEKKEIELINSEYNKIVKRLKVLEQNNEKLTHQLQEKEESEKNLVNHASLLCSALPLMNELAKLVILKTEESAINLTDSIFQISTKSTQVGTHINIFLQDMFSGEKSLKNNIDVLNDEMTRIDKLIEDFSSIQKRYTVDMKKIEENVQSINNFLSGIRDVSDRTGLLAINSSIEAARVGNAGKGFSVLAGEIQLLASTSKDISLEIDDVIKVISNTVEDSFHTLESEIALTLDELSQTQKDLNDISKNLNEKVANVEEHVNHSDHLSKTVTDQLNNVSVNMQYQDITRQIIEHMMNTLFYYRTKLEEKDPQIIALNDLKEQKEIIIKKASSFFTMEDEWKLFGLEGMVREKPPAKEDDDFKGNVEMF